MKIHLSAKPTVKNNKAVVVSFFQSPKLTHSYLKKLPSADAKYLELVMKNDFTTNQERFKEVHLPSDPKKIIVLSYNGKRQEWNDKKFVLFGRKLVTYLKDRKISSASLFLSDYEVPKKNGEFIVKTLAENLIMADFTFNKYKERPKDGWPEIREVEIVSEDAKSAPLKKALEYGTIIGDEVNGARTLANTPGGDMTPRKLAEAALAAGRKYKFKVTVWDDRKIKATGMGGIWGVAKGSLERPKFIIMEYNGSTHSTSSGLTGSPRGGKKSGKPIVFAGKGVTFDTGGLNLKPENSMYEMHMDMSGAAAVIHGISAIARMKLPVNVIGLAPAVENMPSGSSYHPGDVLKSITGKTIEVLNTDAEGRVILSDALGYAQKLNPKLIVDIATLTGAAIVALGQRAIAVFTNEEKLEKFARETGINSGDYVWPLPLWDEYFEDIKGTFGDVANTGKSKYGGAINGAMFLKQFVGNYPWIHLDIAPTMTTIEGQYLTKGASGTGVRFLVELARNVNKLPL